MWHVNETIVESQLPKKKPLMEPTEKGLKVADGQLAGEKAIFVKTKDGFGSTKSSTKRTFKLNLENSKVRRGSAINADLSHLTVKRSKGRKDRVSNVSKMNALRLTAGSVQAVETRKALIQR